MAYHATVVTEPSAEEPSEGMEDPSASRIATASPGEAQLYKLGEDLKLVLPDGKTHRGTVTHESVSGDAMHLTFRLSDEPS
jgi:hypothetical protein